MKIFKLNVDTAKPIRQVVNIPVDTQKYGLAVNCTADGKHISSPFCQLIDGANTLSATSTLDDGSFLFELSATAGAGEREAIVYVINTDELSAADWDGTGVFYFPQDSDKANTDLADVFRAATIWYRKADGTFFADTDLITFTAETHIGHTVRKTIGGRPKNVWEDVAVIPAGKYYPRELDRAVMGGSIGLPANCKAKVVLRPSKAASPDFVVDESVESITIGGVEYTPTTLSVDGVEYVVLAATPSAPDPEPDPEPEPTEG